MTIRTTAMLLSTFTLVSVTNALSSAADKPRSIGRIVRNDAKINKLIPADAKIEVLAEGFNWSEGPVWVPRDGGYVLFSDIPRNSIFKWKEGEGLSLFMKPAGYTGLQPWGPEPGTNGLLLDAQGRLVMCEHGNRRITRLDREKDCIKTVLVSHYQGKKLNSPNDAVFNSKGDLYFTDPPYGLPKREADPRREQPHFGVYRLAGDGTLTLLTAKMTRPNGIALSPDEKRLYVAQSDPKQPIWRVFDLGSDGLPADDTGRIFYDAGKWYGKAPGGCDGLCVDRHGNLFATGPGGVHIFSPDGTHLGLLETNQRTANCTFGGPDGSVLYITADMYLCRVKTRTKGLGFK